MLFIMNLLEKKIQLKERTLNVVFCGNGEPILCLAGFGCDHYIFLSLARELSSKFLLIMIDNRGMGKSDKTNNSYSIEDLANDALEVMERLAISKFHVMGISMGGFIAQHLVNSGRDKVLSLSLLCTLGLGKEFIPIPLLDDQVLTNFYSADPKDVIPAAVGLTTHSSTPKFIISEIIQKRLEHHESLDEALKQRDAVVDFFQNSKIEYHKVSCPVLILTGAEDRFVNPKNAFTLGQKFKNSNVIQVSSSDHYFFMEKPKEVATHLNKFLNQKRESHQ